MAELKEPTETITVTDPTVACDGGGGALGHPRVYLNITAGGLIDCPYCSRRYILKAGAAPTGHH
ncbi:MAG: zinc-finger domain-containing protein [Alphaproteobacteria bacterium]|nr:zinc-finger domain-containing protein [Alphaproteobacteria bacterium]